MAIPDRPLEVTIDPDSLTVGELELFDPAGYAQGFPMIGIREFLVRHTNWTADEIRGLTVAEFRQVTDQIGQVMREQAVPLAK